MTNETYQKIIHCWKSGYKIAKIAKHLNISEGQARNLFSQVLNNKLGVDLYHIYKEHPKRKF